MKTPSSNTPIFEVQDLCVSVEGKTVLQGVSLVIQPGEVHALMGRNGSGKTTLSHALMGHPKYQMTSGRILLNGEDITGLTPDERARKRLFLAFQYPMAIPGVTVSSFLRATIKAVRGEEVPNKEIRRLVRSEMEKLRIPESFLSRSLNDGFSGGEKKRLETLQLQLLQPRVAILDETDSGLDIDALKNVSERIEALRDNNRGILLITHYQRMLNYVKPDHVHVLMGGRIVLSGGADLAVKLEENGYDWIAQEFNIPQSAGKMGETPNAARS